MDDVMEDNAWVSCLDDVAAGYGHGKSGMGCYLIVFEGVVLIYNDSL